MTLTPADGSIRLVAATNHLSRFEDSLIMALRCETAIPDGPGFVDRSSFIIGAARETRVALAGLVRACLAKDDATMDLSREVEAEISASYRAYDDALHRARVVCSGITFHDPRVT